MKTEPHGLGGSLALGATALLLVQAGGLIPPSHLRKAWVFSGRQPGAESEQGLGVNRLSLFIHWESGKPYLSSSGFPTFIDFRTWLTPSFHRLWDLTLGKVGFQLWEAR